MLVLARKVNEVVLIYGPGDVLLGEVKVLEISGYQVRLGFTAPQELIIWRNEIDPHLREAVPVAGTG